MKKNHTFFLPLFGQYTFLILLLSTFSAGIMLYGMKNYAQLQASFINDSFHTYSAMLSKSTMDAYDSFKNLCFYIAGAQDVREYVISSDAQYDPIERKLLQADFRNLAMLNPHLTDIAVYDSNSFLSINSTCEDYQEYIDRYYHTDFGYHAAGITTINSKSCHILIMPLPVDTDNGTEFGMLFVALDINTLLSNQIPLENIQLFFLNENQQLIYGNDELYLSLCRETEQYSSSPTNVYECLSQKYIMNSYFIPDINHTLYVFCDQGTPLEEIITFTKQLLFYLITITLFLLILLAIITHPLLRSLKQMTAYMKSISAGNRKEIKQKLHINQGLIGSREVYEIQHAFNELIENETTLNRTIFDTYTRMYELEANARKTEIAFLRSQINPHFLYNTLTMICGMAAEGMDNKIISVTGALSQIFRYSIKGNDMVPLRQEMDIVRSYLMIQQERFGDRFSIRYTFSEDSHDCLIPKMIIQPLVENAIIHGLEKKVTPGRLMIGAGRNPEHGYLAIWIYDTGVGMPQSKLDELRQAISSSIPHETTNDDTPNLSSANYENVGILNVNWRMVLYYGTEYTLLIDSEEGVGTNIQIRVPYRTE